MGLLGRAKKLMGDPNARELKRIHPDLEIDLCSTDRRVDLIQEGFDCVMRIGTPQASELIIRPVTTIALINCASPAYIEAHGMPRTPDELVHHQLVRYGSADDQFEYLDPDPPHPYRRAPIGGKLVVNSSGTYLGACLAGLGIGQIPGYCIRSLFDTGELVEINVSRY